MKTYLLPAALCISLLSSQVYAQETTQREAAKAQEKAAKAQEKAVEKQRRVEEVRVIRNLQGEPTDIIIRKKNDDADVKLNITIKGDKITVNGKSVDEFEHDDVSVDLNVNPRVFLRSASPFRTGGQEFRGFTRSFSENRTFLGVSTTVAEKGAKVVSVTPGSPAEKAGLQKDDVIIRINETKIENPDGLSKFIREQKKGDKVTVHVLRNNKEQKLSATLEENNTFNFNFEMPEIATLGNMDFFMTRGPRLGIRAQDLEEGDGAKILGIDEDSPAQKSGLKENDIIQSVDGKPVKSVDDLVKITREAGEKSSFDFKVSRDGKTQSLTLKIPKKLKTATL